MQPPRIPAQVLEDLKEDVLAEIPSYTLQRGLDDYRRGQVTHVEVNGRFIEATVHGSAIYEVHINTEWFGLGSSCSCPYEAPCQHMAAVFFAITADYGDPQRGPVPHDVSTDWDGGHADMEASVSPANRASVQSNKTRWVEQAQMPMSVPVPVRSETRSQSQVESQSQSIHYCAPQESDSFTHWLGYLEQEYDASQAEMTRYADAYYMGDYIARVRDKLALHAESWTAGNAFLYKTSVTLITLRSVLEQTGGRDGWSSHIYVDAALSRWVPSLLERIFDTAQAADTSATLFTSVDGEKMLGLANLIRSLLSNERIDSKFVLYAYEFAWWKVLSARLSVTEEIERLDALPPRREETYRYGATSQKKSPAQVQVALARAYLLFLGKRDDEAFHQLKLAPQLDGLAYMLVFPPLQESGQWRRAADWLAWLVDAAGLLDADLFDAYCKWWLLVLEHEPDEAVQEIALSFFHSNMNRAESHYLQYLMATEQTQLWTNLQLAKGRLPYQIPSQSLKYMEKVAPEHLLPLYHHAVEVLVAEKNRNAYKLATRQLKKLAKLYKKLKRQSAWEQFLRLFVARHARLRALHEEMRKAGVME